MTAMPFWAMPFATMAAPASSRACAHDADEPIECIRPGRRWRRPGFQRAPAYGFAGSIP